MSAVPNLPVEARDVHINGLPNGETMPSSTFKLHDSPIENLRRLRVIVIGAGYSGIYLGIRIPEKLRNVDLTIYEKNAGVGGTWWENRYLGCACDVPSHSYQFSFEPNPKWTSLYAPAPEIQAYLERVTKKYSADRFIKLSHEITSCIWDEGSAKWKVTIKNLETGATIHDESDVLISARGNLNNPAWPDIEGLETFEGELMHSAKWNSEYDWNNKRIGVIGSGSSSIQIVPSLQRFEGTQVNVFARSKTWISPSFGQQLFDKYGFKGFSIPQDLQDKFAKDPDHYRRFRMSVEEDGNAIHAVTIKGTPLQAGGKAAFTEHMAQRLESKPELLEALLPSFSPGCRRLTPGPGYLEALTQSNVDFVTSPITQISESAVHTKDGQIYDIDALVCATGFKTSAPPPFALIGINGLTINKKWEKRASAYLSHSISGFPNLFSVMGPNSAIGSGSLTTMFEAVGDYIVKAVRKIQKENIASMVVKQSREDDFVAYIDAYFEKTVFSEECRSWYKNKLTGEIVGLWPGSSMHCIESMRSPRWEDYEYTYVGEAENGGKEANRMGWLGNGWSINQVEERDLAWYLRPEFMDKPVAPKPEEKEFWNVRAFSY